MRPLLDGRFKILAYCIFPQQWGVSTRETQGGSLSELGSLTVVILSSTKLASEILHFTAQMKWLFTSRKGVIRSG